MKKANVKKLLTLALAACLTFTPAYAFAPQTSIKAQAAGDITNPTPIQPDSNTDFSGQWIDIAKDQTDCYKIVLPSDGALTTTLMARNTSSTVFSIRTEPSTDYHSELAHNSVANNTKNSPATNTITSVLSAGTYYITVNNPFAALYGSTSAQYKLKTTFENFGVSETPDSYDSPKSLSVNQTYTDAITLTDKEDWYKVTILENKKYTLKLSAFQTNVTCTIKDSDLHSVASEYCDRNKTETEDVFLNPGVYYLHFTMGPSKYTFSFDTAKITQTSITKVKAVKNKKVDVTFKTTNDVAGYQIRYSTDKNFRKNVKTKTVNLNKTKTIGTNKRVYTASKLKKNKKYYFQIRTYVEKNNAKYYSDWSKSKNIKVK